MKFFSKYPPRILDKSAIVTRFAPSPTDFITIGSLYATFISERLAHQSDGVFYLRVEDTDKKREVDGSIADMIDANETFISALRGTGKPLIHTSDSGIVGDDTRGEFQIEQIYNEETPVLRDLEPIRSIC